MKAKIEVEGREEAKAIRHGLKDPLARALVVIIGQLQQLPSQRARRRVLEYVADKFDEDRVPLKVKIEKREKMVGRR